MRPIGLSETWRMRSMQRNYAYDHMGRLKVMYLDIYDYDGGCYTVPNKVLCNIVFSYLILFFCFNAYFRNKI